MINNFDHGSVTLNEYILIKYRFSSATIPYNADVIREFQAKYLDSLEFRGLDPKV